MTALLKAEYLKNRRRYIFLTALALTAAAGAWAFYGSYTGESGSFALENGYMLYLYQLPLINTIFFPLMCTLIASRLAEPEHSGGGFRRLCVIAERGRVYDAKLIYGIIPVLLCAVLFCAAAAVSGQIAGFTKPLPVKLYLIHLIFTLVPTAALYVLQHSLSMLIENQAVPLCVGALGEFMGLFSMFLPQLGALRRYFPWSWYGALQFVGLFGWTKETRYADAYLAVMGYDWPCLAISVFAALCFYAIGRGLFSRKEI